MLFLSAELALLMVPEWHKYVAQMTIYGTIATAGLPAIGAAIYASHAGAFAGTAERDEALAERLMRLRKLSGDRPLSYETLIRHLTRIADLMTDDVSNWLCTYKARPLALPD